jgi:hypothetical protein
MVSRGVVGKFSRLFFFIFAPMANKYNAKKVRTSIGIFDSIGEYNHYKKLCLLKNATDESQRVVDIQRQVNYSFSVNGIYIGQYRSDFVVHYANGRIEVHDFKNPYLTEGKGKSTPAGQLFNYKKKLLKAIHGIDLIVVTK